jgi:GT2 family glycosyltransferase
VSITVVVLTHNRVHLLRQCVENVLARTTEDTKEIIIWDNGSTDGTWDYLATLSQPRITTLRSDENIGLNAYALCFARAQTDYLLELDDDIIDAPDGWDRTLLNAFQALPDVGYLAANLIDNPNDRTSQIMYGPSADKYSYSEENGVRLKIGPTGGGCTITSRELYDRVGGFRTNEREIFWQEDAEYVYAIARLGYRAAYVDDLKVLHAGGPFYSEPAPAKVVFWNAYWKKRRRRNAVKRVLLLLPFVRRLNDRLGLFVAPEQAPLRAPPAQRG